MSRMVFSPTRRPSMTSWSQDLAAAAFSLGRVHGHVEGDDGGVGRGWRRAGRPRSEVRELGGGPLGDERFGVADAEQQLPVGQVAFAGGVLGGGCGDHGGDRDAEGEADRGQGRSGAGLVAGQVAQRQPCGDGRAASGGGEARIASGLPSGIASDDGHGAADDQCRIGLVVDRVDASREAGHADDAGGARPPAAERRAGLGRGGRADRARVTGIRAAVRAGHQAAAVAVTTASSMPATMSHHGRSNRSIRWPAAVSSRGATAIQAKRASGGPGHGGEGADGGAVGQQHQPEVPLVAPIAASMPSWRRRRWATTTKPAAAIRATSSRTTVAKPSTPAAAVARSVWVAVGQSRRPMAGGARLEPATVPRRKAVARSWLARTRIVTDFGGSAAAGATRANSSSRSPGFSTRPTTVRSTPVEGEGAADAGLEGRRHRVGDRDLAGGGGVAALPEPQHRRAVGAVRVLGRAAPGARPSPGPARLGGRSPRRCRTRP